MNTMFSDSSPNEGRGLGFLLIKRVSERRGKENKKKELEEAAASSR